LGQVAHEPQEVWTLDTLIKDLVTETASVCYTCEESGVLDLDGHVPYMLESFLSSGIVGTLLVKVEAGFIYEDDLTVTFELCTVTW